MTSIRDLTKRDTRLTSGHRACAGCTQLVALRQAIGAIEDPVVVAAATGCMEVVTTIFPYTAWNVPYVHSTFENAAATISGVEAAYRAMRARGEIPDRRIKFVAFAGDGGSYDIGLQSLSGALERGHDFLFICYDNEGYMNTGVQRSGATPFGAWTNTTPDSEMHHGKARPRKDLTEIVVAHGVPYAAQACISHWKDYVRKVEKAVRTEGPTFLNVLVPCTVGWKFPPEQGVEVAKLAVETCFWPLYEFENGNHRLNHRPREKRPITDWTSTQGRFRHLDRPGNEGLAEELQRQVDRRWENLLRRCSP
jgi:pyruvate ferredoxin oxidoreductase beta subunit